MDVELLDSFGAVFDQRDFGGWSVRRTCVSATSWPSSSAVARSGTVRDPCATSSRRSFRAESLTARRNINKHE